MDVVEKMPVRLKVASILRDAILSGEFADGQSLSLTDTAARLQVSRTPVREALQLLESEGLIELRMNREAIVRTIDRDFITKHFDMRILLEGEAVERAVRNAADLMPLLELQNAIGHLDPAALSASYDDYNYDFHTIIWEAADNRKLFTFLDSLWNGPTYSHTTGNIVDHSTSVQEHENIVRSMQIGDADTAKSMMRQHVRRSMDIILASFK